MKKKLLLISVGFIIGFINYSNNEYNAANAFDSKFIKMMYQEDDGSWSSTNPTYINDWESGTYTLSYTDNVDVTHSAVIYYSSEGNYVDGAYPEYDPDLQKNGCHTEAGYRCYY